MTELILPSLQVTFLYTFIGTLGVWSAYMCGRSADYILLLLLKFFLKLMIKLEFILGILTLYTFWPLVFWTVNAFSASESYTCKWQRCGYLKEVGLLCEGAKEECGTTEELVKVLKETRKGAVVHECGLDVKCEEKK